MGMTGLFLNITESVASGGPLHKHLPQTAAQTRRNGAKHHVQQSHPYRPPRTERRSQSHAEQQRLRHPQHRHPAELENDKSDSDNRTEWHRLYAWSDLSNFAKTLQNGQLIALEGKLKLA
jgi:hypothetical protein